MHEDGRSQPAEGRGRRAAQAIGRPLGQTATRLTALAVQSDEHRKKQTLAIRDDFKEFLVREKIDLAAARHAPAAIQLTNQMIPPKVGPGGTEAAPSEGKNLLAALDVSQNGVQGTWLLEGGKLVSPTEDHAQLQVPAELPAEYDLTLDVVRVAGQGELAVGLLREGTQSVFLVDVGGAKSGIAGRKTGVYAGAVLPEGQKVRLLFRLRHNTFTVTAASKQIFSANEEPLPAVSQTWQVRDPSKLFLGANHSVFRVESSSFVPLRNSRIQNMESKGRTAPPMELALPGQGTIRISVNLA